MSFLVNSKKYYRAKRVVVVLLGLAWLSATMQLFAQKQNRLPSLSGSSGSVTQSGYLLKPTGLSTGDWPQLRFDFSIERGDQTIFKSLTLADVETRVDGLKVALTEGSLKLNEGEGSSALVLLDISGSMSSGKVDKLRAAKQALQTLINALSSTDRVSLMVFDEEPQTVVSATTDKNLVKARIEELNIRKGKSRFTRLYDAVDSALKEAKQQKVKNILLISDGWEDTLETRKALSSSGLSYYKQQREQAITQFSRDGDIRIFTVAIGDEHGLDLSYVDRQALANIAKGANGGSGVYIELTADSVNEALQEERLLSRLQQTLDDLRQSFRYSYSLTLNLGETPFRDGQDHKLWLGFTVGDNPRVQLPVEYTYSWATSLGAPVVTAVKVQPAIFIQSAPRSVKWQQLLVIYMLLMSTLIVLALIPVIGRRLMGEGRKIRLYKAITTVGTRSPLVGSMCPNEGINSGRAYLFREGDIVLVCPQCRTGHHLSCWRFNEHHCMNRTCEFEMVVPAHILEQYELVGRSFHSA